MKVMINPLSSLSGWTTSNATVTLHGLCTDRNFIAQEHAASTIVRFNGALNQYANLPISPAVNVGKMRDVTIAVWSRNKASVDYQMPSQFSYKIDFGTGTEYYLPVWPQFDGVTIRVPENAVVSRIRITALHNDDDYLIISNCIACKDNLPYDVLEAARSKIQLLMTEAFPVPGRSDLAGIKVGTFGSAVVGQDYIECATQPDFVDRYAKIYITNGVIGEVHNIDRMTLNETTGLGPMRFYFGDQGDGKSLTATYTGAGGDVYLLFDVSFARKSNNIVLPSVTIWGFSSGFEYENTEQWQVLDSWDVVAQTVQSRMTGQLVEWSLLIDCEARNYELIEYMAQVVRKFIVYDPIWVNGLALDKSSDGTSNEVEPNEAFGIIPKVQYPIKLKVREDIWERTTLAKALPPTITVNPSNA